MNFSLISRSTTTGWFDWEPGELWLGSEGILRRKLGWRKTISGEGIFEDMDADGSEPAIVQDFTSQAIDEVVNLGGLWIPADAVRNARLRAGFS